MIVSLNKDYDCLCLRVNGIWLMALDDRARVSQWFVARLTKERRWYTT